MWLEWRDGQISFIRDYRYVVADAELALASDVKPAGDGAADSARRAHEVPSRPAARGRA